MPNACEASNGEAGRLTSTSTIHGLDKFGLDRSEGCTLKSGVNMSFA